MTATQEQLEEVWSWIHNERRCVTIQTVSLAMGMARSQASLLLRKIPTHKPGEYSYECTKCCISQKNDKTVIQLQKSIVSANDMDTDEDDAKIYSLALVDTESVHTAHEKDMATFRDSLKEEDSPGATATSMALEPTLHQFRISNEANFGNTRMTAHASQQERFSGRVVAGAAAAMPPSTSSRMPSAAAARKATTAANFFANNNSTANSKDTKKPPTSKKAAVPSKRAPKKKKDEPQAMEVDSEEEETTTANVTSSSGRGEEKENSVNKKTVGNVDDFVGDVDSDDDEEFQESEKERKRRNTAREEKQRKKKAEQPVEEEEEEEPPVKVHGAMDAFAQHVEKKPSEQEQARTTKRRKRLVEKTTMDANGYIHTETQAVWEDVEDEEEPVVEEQQKTAPVKKKAPVKNTKNMKQGNLMGFFKKK